MGTFWIHVRCFLMIFLREKEGKEETKKAQKGVRTKHTSLHHIYYTRARSLEKRFLKRKKRTKKLASDTIVVLVFQRAFEEEREEAFCRAAFKKKSVVGAVDKNIHISCPLVA